MTQGYPLSPTIFNVVVDTVVRHWEALVAGETEGVIIDNDKAEQTTAERTIQ